MARLNVRIYFPEIRSFGDDLRIGLQRAYALKRTAIQRMIYSLLHSTFKRRSGKLREAADVDFAIMGSGKTISFVPRVTFDLNKAPHAATLINTSPQTIRSHGKAMAVPMPGSEADRMLSPAIRRFGELVFRKDKASRNTYAYRPKGTRPLFVLKKSVTIKKTLDPKDIQDGLINVWNPIVDAEVNKILRRK